MNQHTPFEMTKLGKAHARIERAGRAFANQAGITEHQYGHLNTYRPDESSNSDYRVSVVGCDAQGHPVERLFIGTKDTARRQATDFLNDSAEMLERIVFAVKHALS